MGDFEAEMTKGGTLDVSLKNDNSLDSAVIIGAYGSKQKREDLVGSAFQVGAEQFKNLPKDRIEGLLTGAVPGLVIEPNTDGAGTPRTRFSIRVRGSASLTASNEPLWIIDGVPMYTGGETNIMPGTSYSVSPLSLINPDDIESMTVLKDADQTSIYGANGSNGVVIITTKSGSFETPMRITANVSYGVSTPDYSTMFKVMNAQQYMEVAKEAWANAGNSADSFPYLDNPYNSYSTTSTDWARLYLSPASTKNISLSLRSGTKKISNLISASYFDDSNVQHSNKTKRFTLNQKNDIKFGERVNLALGLSASYTIDDLFAISSSYLDALPIFEPYNADGSYRLYNYLNYYVDADGVEHYTKKKFHDNDIPDANENEDRQIAMVTAANANLRVKILEGLNLSTIFRLNYHHVHEDEFGSVKTLSGVDSNGDPYGSSRRNDATYLDWASINQLTFDRNFGRSRFYAMGGLELRHHLTKTLSASGYGFLNDYIQEMSFLDKENIYTNSGTTVTRNLSYFGRAEYNFDKRYYLAANIRRDGTSDFGAYSKWDSFWSVGASWNIHNENFFKSNVINMMKLKLSVGDNGNSRVGTSNFAGTYLYSTSYGYGGKMGAQLGSVANPYLSWERTFNFNVGLRMEFLEGRLSFESEYYNNRTRDLISQVYTSRTISSDRVWANVGKMRNAGVEFSLESINIKRGDFVWSTRFNASHNDNRITELYNGVPISYGSSVDAVGHPRRALYLVRWAGVDPADGLPLWYDLEGNITKTYSTDNRVIIDGQEIAIGSISNDFSFGDWTLGFQINYKLGGKATPTYAHTLMYDGYDIIGGNQAVEVYYYRWRQPGDLTSFTKVSNSSLNSVYTSTRYMVSTTYFDLYNVSLSYRLPETLLRKISISDGSLTLSGNNLYFLTPHQSRKFNSYKTMSNGYPRVRKINLSLNLSF